MRKKIRDVVAKDISGICLATNQYRVNEDGLVGFDYHQFIYNTIHILPLFELIDCVDLYYILNDRIVKLYNNSMTIHVFTTTLLRIMSYNCQFEYSSSSIKKIYKNQKKINGNFDNKLSGLYMIIQKRLPYFSSFEPFSMN